jgi:hypothetical protein
MLLQSTQLMRQQQIEESQARAALSFALKELEVQLPNCMIEATSPFQLARMPKTWWQAHGCVMGSYYYAIEFLGHDPCALVDKKENNQLITADYYRITLYGKSILQSIEVKSSFAITACSGKLHTILAGRQMLRELIGI